MAGVVIVGAGHGGTQAAASLRESGYEGPVTLISNEPDFPYHRPPLSKAFMKSDDETLQFLRGPSFFEDKGIDLVLGHRVASLDRDAKAVVREDGTQHKYDHLILALGTTARPLNVPGVSQKGVLSLRTAEDARWIRDHLPDADKIVVIGGGFIGLETAAMLAAKGKAITVLEAAPAILGRASSPEMASAIADSLTDMGVDLVTQAAVEAIDGLDGAASGVQLADGRRFDADLVLVGIGAVPIIDLAEASGLATSNGIEVDATLRTSDPTIFAIGDNALFPNDQIGASIRLESVQNATDQAKAVAKTITGTETPYGAVPWFWSDIGDKKLQIAGLMDGADQRATWQDEQGLRAVYHLKQGQLLAVETLNAPAVHMLARRLIGAALTPPLAVLTNGDVAAMKALLKPA